MVGGPFGSLRICKRTRSCQVHDLRASDGASLGKYVRCELSTEIGGGSNVGGRCLMVRSPTNLFRVPRGDTIRGRGSIIII